MPWTRLDRSLNRATALNCSCRADLPAIALVRAFASISRTFSSDKDAVKDIARGSSTSYSADAANITSTLRIESAHDTASALNGSNTTSGTRARAGAGTALKRALVGRASKSVTRNGRNIAENLPLLGALNATERVFVKPASDDSDLSVEAYWLNDRERMKLLKRKRENLETECNLADASEWTEYCKFLLGVGTDRVPSPPDLQLAWSVMMSADSKKPRVRVPFSLRVELLQQALLRRLPLLALRIIRLMSQNGTPAPAYLAAQCILQLFFEGRSDLAKKLLALYVGYKAGSALAGRQTSADVISILRNQHGRPRPPRNGRFADYPTGSRPQIEPTLRQAAIAVALGINDIRSANTIARQLDFNKNKSHLFYSQMLALYAQQRRLLQLQYTWLKMIDEFVPTRQDIAITFGAFVAFCASKTARSTFSQGIGSANSHSSKNDADSKVPSKDDIVNPPNFEQREKLEPSKSDEVLSDASMACSSAFKRESEREKVAGKVDKEVTMQELDDSLSDSENLQQSLNEFVIDPESFKSLPPDLERFAWLMTQYYGVYFHDCALENMAVDRIMEINVRTSKPILFGASLAVVLRSVYMSQGLRGLMKLHRRLLEMYPASVFSELAESHIRSFCFDSLDREKFIHTTKMEMRKKRIKRQEFYIPLRRRTPPSLPIARRTPASYRRVLKTANERN